MDPDQISSDLDLHCFLKGYFLLCTTINELVKKSANNFYAPIFGDMWSFK